MRLQTNFARQHTACITGQILYGWALLLALAQNTPQTCSVWVLLTVHKMGTQPGKQLRQSGTVDSLFDMRAYYMHRA